MKRVRIVGSLVTLIAVMGLILLTACAGSKRESMEIDENAFPEEKQQSSVSSETTEPTPDEAEVLQLLGITSGGEKAQAEKSSAKKPASESVGQLEARISKLESQVKEKDKELRNLKAELDERESRIAALRSKLTTPSTGPSAAATSTTATAGGSFKEKYRRALDLYNNRQYKEALRLFDELLSLGVDNDLVDNCQYWKGECYYALGDYNQAIIEFEKVFTYNNSNKYPDAQLKLGLCYLKLGNRDRARAEFEKLVNEYPDSEYVPRAQSYLAQLQ